MTFRVMMIWLCAGSVFGLGCESTAGPTASMDGSVAADQGRPVDGSAPADAAMDVGARVDGGPMDASAISDATMDVDARADGASSDARTPDARTPDARIPEGRGPAYAAGTAGCPADDGVRRVKLVNNCTETRWFKLDGRTTPRWARSNDCPWAGVPCGDPEDVLECNAIARGMMGGEDPGNVYCKEEVPGGAASCACNPFFRLEPGEQHEIAMPEEAAFSSGAGWLAVGCNALGADCALGDEAAKNSTFEFTYDPPGAGLLWYDISAVNAWTSASAVGMRSCGATSVPDPDNVFWCRGTGCRFDVETQCPDGSDAFAAADGACGPCPTREDGGRTVIDGACGRCSDGASGNLVPTNVTFNARSAPEFQWTWTGSPDFARGWGYDQGARTDRGVSCVGGVCSLDGPTVNTCLSGCDLCTSVTQAAPESVACLKYCCPDGVHRYDGHDYRYDSQGCTAIGVQPGTDYTVAVKTECPYVYTFAYEDHSSTFTCQTSASLIVQSCPDPMDFPTRW